LFGSLTSQKGLIYIVLGNLLGATLTGGFWLLLATIQSVEEYGKTNYEVAIASLAASAALLGLNTTVTSYLAKGSSKINIQANQVVLISGGIAAVVVSFVDWYLSAFVIGMTFWMMSTYELLGKKQYKQYAMTIIGARGSQMILSIGLFYVLGVMGIILGFAISFLLFSQRYFISTKQFSLIFDEVKSKMKFASHAYSFNMSNAFLMYFDKLVILPLFGYAILGYYQLGFQFLLFLGMIPISFYQYLLSEESSGLRKTKVRLVGILVSVCLTVVLFASSPWIVQTFFPHFENSIDAIRIMSIGIIPMMIVWILNSRFLTVEKTRYVLIGSAVYVSLQMSLIVQLGNVMGVVGLALAVILALSAQAAFLYGSSRYLRVSF
jgi:O-antigen/teichoic acid export membrane protein